MNQSRPSQNFLDRYSYPSTSSVLFNNYPSYPIGSHFPPIGQTNYQTLQNSLPMVNNNSNSEPPVTSDARVAAAVAAALGLNLSTVHLEESDSAAGQASQSFNSSESNGQFDKTLSSPPTDRPHQCPTCSRRFSVKAGLVQHMRTHTDERPYPCLHCGRAFKQKIQLTTHMRVHSGERPYGCRLCGKLFRQQSHVVQHLRTHTGEKPHKCFQCGKAFRQKYSLVSHQRRMCRNRSSGNPITTGMTMWISPGTSGGTGSLVKEFSPSKSIKTDDGCGREVVAPFYPPSNLGFPNYFNTVPPTSCPFPQSSPTDQPQCENNGPRSLDIYKSPPLTSINTNRHPMSAFTGPVSSHHHPINVHHLKQHSSSQPSAGPTNGGANSELNRPISSTSTDTRIRLS